MTPPKKQTSDTVTILPADDGVELFARVRAILYRARAVVFVAANTVMVGAYWNVVRKIVEKQGGAVRAKYGDNLVKTLAVRLTTEFGEGVTALNLFNIRQFYFAFPKFDTLCRDFMEMGASFFYTLEGGECNTGCPTILTMQEVL